MVATMVTMVMMVVTKLTDAAKETTAFAIVLPIFDQGNEVSPKATVGGWTW